MQASHAGRISTIPAAATVSMFTDSVSALVLPLTAVLVLHARAMPGRRASPGPGNIPSRALRAYRARA